MELIDAGEYEKAESLATEFIASSTDIAASWMKSAAIESYLCDSVFNRGQGAGAMILQMALGLQPDGVVGPATRAVLAVAETILSGCRRTSGPRARNMSAARGTSRAQPRQSLEQRAEIRKNVPVRRAQERGKARARDHGRVHARAIPRGPDLSPVSDGTMPTADLVLPLPALRLGSRGAMVKAWQIFLIGQKLDPGEPDGIFGYKTDEATRTFQTKAKIEADGVVGRQTLRKALDRGFELMEEPAADGTGSNFPPKPSFPPLVTNAQRQAIFGPYDYVADPKPRNPEHIRILGTWEQDNIVDVPIPQLKKTAIGSKAPSTIRFHRLGAAQLQGLWKEWESAKLLDRILSFAGASSLASCAAARPRSRTTPSARPSTSTASGTREGIVWRSRKGLHARARSDCP